MATECESKLPIPLLSISVCSTLSPSSLSISFHSLVMSAHTREFLSLYRRLLRLHQRLPQDYATIGTSFLRNEFKNHRSAKDEFVAPFLMEWRVRCSVTPVGQSEEHMSVYRIGSNFCGVPNFIIVSWSSLRHKNVCICSTQSWNLHNLGIVPPFLGSPMNITPANRKLFV